MQEWSLAGDNHMHVGDVAHSPEWAPHRAVEGGGVFTG